MRFSILMPCSAAIDVRGNDAYRSRRDCTSPKPHLCKKVIDTADASEEKDARDAGMPSTGLCQNDVHHDSPVAKWVLVPEEPTYFDPPSRGYDII